MGLLEEIGNPVAGLCGCGTLNAPFGKLVLLRYPRHGEVSEWTAGVTRGLAFLLLWGVWREATPRLLNAGSGSGDKVGLERLCHGWLDVGCTEGWILCSVYDGFGELLGRRGVPRTTPMPRGPSRSTRSGMDLVLRYTGAVNLAYLDRKAHLQSLSMLG